MAINTPIYVINLDQDTDRLASITERLNHLKLPFKRFSAYRGKNIPDHLKSEFFLDRSCSLQDGEVGCYASHLDCMKRFIDTGLPSAIILEDDVDFHPDFSRLISEFCKLPPDLDILRLSSVPKYSYVPVGTIEPCFELVKYSKIPHSTGGYYITHCGAQKFVRFQKPRTNPLDIDMRHAWTRNLITYGISPQVVSHVTGFSSSIEKVNSKLDPKKRRRSVFSFSESFTKRICFNIRFLSFRFWFFCLLRNFYIQIYRRLRKNVPNSIKRIKPDIH